MSIGITKPTCCMQLSDKKIIEALCLHYTVLVSLAELEQLRLAIQNFNSLLQSAPASIQKAFEPST